MTTTPSLPELGQPVSRTDLVAEWIRAEILGGAFKPGDVLVERQLAEQLGISKTPVREALIMLARTRLLTSGRNRGMKVRSLTLKEIRHVYEERVLLEPWALRTAIDDEGSDFTEAVKELRESDKHADNGDQAARIMANRRFHRALYSQCENDLVVDALDGLQDMVALAAVTVFWQKSGTDDTEAQEHAKIAEAAINGDGQLAETLLRDHIQTSIDRASSQN